MSATNTVLSYNRKHAAAAKRFADAFAAECLNAWSDTEMRSSEVYDGVAKAALSRTKAVAALVWLVCRRRRA